MFEQFVNKMHGNLLQPNMDEVKEMVARFTENDRPKVVSATEILKYDYISVRALFQFTGVYVWPTTELIDWIKGNIPDLSKTIEIGSGNGVLAKTLGITATDSFLQSNRFEPKSAEESEVHKSGLEMYRVMRQKLINYGENVEQFDAIDAIMRYKPNHVLGCYITHKHREGMREGNQLGVNEEWILKRRQFKTYTMVGNLHVHGSKPILAIPHEEIELEGLLVRAEFPEKNRIFRWNKESIADTLKI